MSKRTLKICSLPSSAVVALPRLPFLSPRHNMSAAELLRARLLIAEADRAKKTRKNAVKDINKENKRAKQKQGKKGESDEKKKRKAPTVQWAKPAFHHLTDELLTIVEGSARYKQAFSFDKGQSGRVDTGGKTIPDLCADIAIVLFNVDSVYPDGGESKYTSADLTGLSYVIKNRVNSLKKSFSEHHEKLGATGHGLVTGGKEDEIIGGSAIANAWEAIEGKFPWYKRMDLLMGTNPIVNRTAVAHSNTRVDLNVLDRDGEAHTGPISVKDDSSSEGEPFSDWNSSSPVKTRRRVGRDAADVDESDGASISISSSPPMRPKAKSPTTPAARIKSEPTSVSASARGAKRKTTHEHVAEIASQDRVQRIKLMELKEKGKTARSRAKYDAKTQLELARMKHQEAEAERQRQHDIFMMDRQMQLETMRRGGPIPASVHQSFAPGGPANGAPPPMFYDPALF
ncbi:hypothetical protein DFH06DRAFT_1326650 [Mycena polygramma]|nr:hypothetical protein DFH06DRAFT_1326650 [Mycena polygramma]